MDKIAVLDFGGQYAHLIGNRVRRLGVYSEIFDGEVKAEQLKGFQGIILSGGPQSVYDEGAIQCDPALFDLGIPVLAICYGHQLLAQTLGAKVAPAQVREYGATEMVVKEKKSIFEGLDDMEMVWMSHGDTVTDLPQGFEVFGSTQDGECAAIGNVEKSFFGIQFHPEVTHTVHGRMMLDNFLKICGVKREWKIDNFIEQEMGAARKFAGDKKVFMLISGGVDSTVAYALLAKALGSERVYGMFVNTGFLRKAEVEQVEKSLRDLGFSNLHVEDASAQYFEALKGVYEPEAKRKIIGELFIQVAREALARLNFNTDEWLLGQGTIYPDTIESGGTKHAAKIKTHHNRIEAIEKMIQEGKVIEPLAQLYKDEVREVGEKLGIPRELVWRHPFPGPGLAVRCLCAEGDDYPDGYAELENTLNAELQEHNLQGRLLPIKSVGVQGDFRTYRHPLVVMGKSDFKVLGALATRMINQHREINRVMWMVGGDNIEKVNVKAGYLTPERIALLQEADKVVHDFMVEKQLDRKIWQFPTVLIPISVNGENTESVVLRPVESEEAMTANFYQMDLELVQELGKRVLVISGIGAVFYDVTSKPPGTIEWE